jgi:Protein of unknown function (DUF3301)
MDPAWSALLFILVATAVGWFWHDSLAARESANLAAQEACQRLGLQLLDGTVAFARLGLTRSPAGHVVLRRTYVFDYTANSIERRQGFLMLAGRYVESVGYAPGEQGRQPAPSPPEPPAIPATPVGEVSPMTRPSAQVFRLEDWRRNRQQRPPASHADDVDDAQR